MNTLPLKRNYTENNLNTKLHANWPEIQKSTLHENMITVYRVQEIPDTALQRPRVAAAKTSQIRSQVILKKINPL